MKEENRTTAYAEQDSSVEVAASQATPTKLKNRREDYFSGVDLSKIKVDINEMFRAGVHFGHHKSRRNPLMDTYIFTTKNGVSIFDLEKTAQKMKEASDFIREIVASGQDILFVGTKKQAKALVESIAKKCAMPYVSERWLGGTFTNFPVISGRTKYLREGQEKMNRGEYSKYTKFEQMKIAEELGRMERKMGGIKNMTKFPGAIFVAGIIEDNLAVLEAKKRNIPVIALVDSNANPRDVDYVIPANEDAVSALRIMLGYIGKAIMEGQSQRVIKAEKEEAKAK